MRKVLILVLTPLGLLLGLVACSYNSVEDLRGEVNPCDTVTADWSGSVISIIRMNCANNSFNPDQNFGCHGAGTPGAQGSFEDYSRVKGLVDAGRIQERALVDNNEMPPAYSTGPKALSDCDKTIIQNWIDAGAPEN